MAIHDHTAKQQGALNVVTNNLFHIRKSLPEKYYNFAKDKWGKGLAPEIVKRVSNIKILGL